jgi:hypothetical protein
MTVKRCFLFLASWITPDISIDPDIPTGKLPDFPLTFFSRNIGTASVAKQTWHFILIWRKLRIAMSCSLANVAFCYFSYHINQYKNMYK